jgi:hypothetical protein
LIRAETPRVEANTPPASPGDAENGEPIAGQRLGAQLKTYFDRLTDGPTPERLLRLTEQLEAAFERGDLRCSAARRG